MIRLIFIFAVALFVTLFTMYKVEAAPPIPPNEQLVRAPFLIEYQKRPHAVFDYGGLYFLFEITKTPIPFPQCNAVRTINNELMIVGETLMVMCSLPERTQLHSKQITIHFGTNW